MSISFPMVPRLEVSALILAFIGFTVGVVGGFIGVGGGYMVTPALIVLGFPANFAVGTGVAQIVASAIVGSFRHRKLGNMDVKLGLAVLPGAFLGIEFGVRILNWAESLGLADQTVLGVSLIVLAATGGYTYRETTHARRILEEMRARGETLPRRIRTSTLDQKIQSVNLAPMVYFPHCRVRICFWVVIGIGFLVGVLIGLLGVGGGFIMVPAMIYLIGVPSLIAAGTSLLQIFISGMYGLVRHTMSGNVLIYAAVIMTLGAAVGVQIGSLATRYVRAPSLRLVLSYSILFATVGVALNLAYVLTGHSLGWLLVAARVVTFGQMGILVVIIGALFLMGLLKSRGRKVPEWAESFLV